MVHRIADVGGIVLSRLSKFYGPGRAVRSIDLTIAPGETVALPGPNGAGKTTTIDMMLGLTRPDTGTVSVFGRRQFPAVLHDRDGGVRGDVRGGLTRGAQRVRQVRGWTGQVSITPLRARTDIAAKVVTAYLTAVLVAAATLGSRRSAARG